MHRPRPMRSQCSVRQGCRRREAGRRARLSRPPKQAHPRTGPSLLSREECGRTVGAAAPAGPFAGSCDILPHRRGRRMFEAECCYACIGKSGTQDPMSARWWLPAWATSQGPEGRRANSGSDTLRLSRRQGWPGNSRELDGRVWKSSVFTITPRIPYHTPIFGHYGMVWYHNPVFGNYGMVWYGMVWYRPQSVPSSILSPTTRMLCLLLRHALCLFRNSCDSTIPSRLAFSFLIPYSHIR
jgi:hypothetical protein